MRSLKSISLTLVLLLSAIIMYAQDRTAGLIIYDSLAYEGYTLFSPMSARKTFLIDNCGREVNTWNFSSSPGLLAYLDEDGALLRAESIVGSFGAGGSGGRIVKKSWDDQEIWSFKYSDDIVKQHHDFQVMPNGNILLLAWERKTRDQAIEAGRAPGLTPNEGVWFEHLVELEPIGSDSAKIVWQWHVFDHLVQERDTSKLNYGKVSDTPERFNINYKISNPFSPSNPGVSDWMHFNSIQYHKERDEILISSRSFNEVYIIDHSTTSEEAKTDIGGVSGKGGGILFRWGNDEAFNKGGEENQMFFAQHHASWIDKNDENNVSFTVYNNGIDRPTGDNSSIDFITPKLESDAYVLGIDGTFEIVEYNVILDTPNIRFSSSRLSSAQVLKNNNILITSGNNGKIVELTSNNKVVWEYINPINNFGAISQGQPTGANDLFRAERYDFDFTGFKDKSLEPSETLENNTDLYECIIYDTLTNNIEVISDELVKVFPNPVIDQLKVEVANSKIVKVELFAINGKLIYDYMISNAYTIPMVDLNEGIYILRASFETKSRTFKIIKI